MLRVSLVFLAAIGLLLAARYSLWPARTYREWWVALFATELGHVWCVLAAGLAVWAARIGWGAQPGVLRSVALAAAVTAGLAALGFARPALTAWRLSAGVERELGAVFGPGGEQGGSGAALWSWSRLWRWPTAVDPVAVEPGAVGAGEGEPGAVESFDAAGRTVDFYRPRAENRRRQSLIDFGSWAMGGVGAGGGGGGGGAGAPCVVLVHGGGWDGGSRTELAGLNRWLAARGVAVAAFDYRLAPESPWPAQREDLRVVVEWIRANAGRLGVDPERLTVLGRSAGGQIATATAYGERLPGVRAVVALYACHDLEFVWSIRSEKDALNSDLLVRQFMGGGPEGPGQAERYRSASGERLVQAGAPKTLLIHGALDELVWCRHSERLAAALAREGVPHVLVKLPWATHAGEANLHGPSGQLITEAVWRVATGR